MSVRAFRIAYDGRPFHGFQRQPSVPTVENALLSALSSLGVTDSEDEVPPGYAAAGRTDAGVSALAQTVAFDCPEWCSPRALNSRLPTSVRAWASAEAPADFHATHHAERRSYVYDLYAPDLDDEAARAAAEALSGEHDFHNLTPDADGTVRDLSLSVDRDGDFLVLRATAGGFARELVRRLASVVRGVASGDLAPSEVERLLGPEAVEGPDGIPPAPPEPLVLAEVTYPNLAFDRDDDAAESAVEEFAGRRIDGLVRSRVAGRICDGVAGDDATSAR
jgi:tRNA pseudouridine38-40 synthase